MSSTRLKLVSITTCLAFALAACGDDKKSATTDAPVTTVAETTAPSATDAPDTVAPETNPPETSAPDTSVPVDYDLVDISGDYLTDPLGLTLYIFTQDPADGTGSACYDACATTWPPVIIPEGDFELTLPDECGESPRDDGLPQLTYLGQPLYYYAGDTSPGDKNGDGVGGVWFIVDLTA